MKFTSAILSTSLAISVAIAELGVIFDIENYELEGRVGKEPNMCMLSSAFSFLFPTTPTLDTMPN